MALRVWVGGVDRAATDPVCSLLPAVDLPACGMSAAWRGRARTAVVLGEVVAHVDEAAAAELEHAVHHLIAHEPAAPGLGRQTRVPSFSTWCANSLPPNTCRYVSMALAASDTCGLRHQRPA